MIAVIKEIKSIKIFPKQNRKPNCLFLFKWLFFSLMTSQKHFLKNDQKKKAPEIIRIFVFVDLSLLSLVVVFLLFSKQARTHTHNTQIIIVNLFIMHMIVLMNCSGAVSLAQQVQFSLLHTTEYLKKT